MTTPGGSLSLGLGPALGRRLGDADGPDPTPLPPRRRGRPAPPRRRAAAAAAASRAPAPPSRSSTSASRPRRSPPARSCPSRTPSPRRPRSRRTTRPGPFALDPADLPATAPEGGAAHDRRPLPPRGRRPVARHGHRACSTGRRRGGGAGLGGPGDGRGRHVGHRSRRPSTSAASRSGESRDADGQRSSTRATLSPVTLTSAELPAGGFSIVGDPFPLTVRPGEAASVDAPLRRPSPAASTTARSGSARPTPADPSSSRSSPRASAPAGRSSPTSATCRLDGSGRTTTLSVSVPADAISLYLEGDGERRLAAERRSVSTPSTGPGGKVYENTSSTGRLHLVRRLGRLLHAGPQHGPVEPPARAGRRHVHSSACACCSGSPTRCASAPSSSVATRRRRRRPRCPLNVFLADGIAVTAATAPTDTFLQAVLTRMDEILVAAGHPPRRHRLLRRHRSRPTTRSRRRASSPTLLETTHRRHARRASTSSSSKLALGGGVVGVVRDDRGPEASTARRLSGVMSVYAGLLEQHDRPHRRARARSLPRPLPHRGTERRPRLHRRHGRVPRQRDQHAPAPSPGGGYLMHWQAVGGTDITDGQGLVIRGHPHMDVDDRRAAPKPSAQAAPRRRKPCAEVLASRRAGAPPASACTPGPHAAQHDRAIVTRPADLDPDGGLPSPASRAEVAELADALGSGPSGLNGPCGFESPLRHQPSPLRGRRSGALGLPGHTARRASQQRSSTPACASCGHRPRNSSRSKR